MKLNWFEGDRPFWEANVWIYNGVGDALLLERFTTKAEAIKCVKDFRKKYKGGDRLDCFVSRFDADEFCEYSINV